MKDQGFIQTLLYFMHHGSFMTSNASPDWELFELAVAQFIAAINQGAKVTHDVRLPDVHTGHPRQRDVWVEWSFGGHFPA